MWAALGPTPKTKKIENKKNRKIEKFIVLFTDARVRNKKH
jgi:hypothetical protein